MKARTTAIATLFVAICLSFGGCVTSGPWIINDTEKPALIFLVTTETPDDWQRWEIPPGGKFNLFGEGGVPPSSIVSLKITCGDSTITLEMEYLQRQLSEIGRWYKAVILIHPDGVKLVSRAEYRQIKKKGRPIFR